VALLRHRRLRHWAAEGDGAEGADAGEIVEEVAERSESAAGVVGFSSKIVEWNVIVHQQVRNIRTQLPRVVAKRRGERVLFLIGLVTAALRHDRSHTEQRQPRDAVDSDARLRVKGVLQIFWFGSKFEIELAIGRTKFVHRIRRKGVSPRSADV